MAQLQTYIKVCRTLKPQFTRESAQILKDEYKKLRQTCANRQNAATSYRYTVRQLESMIRLSEAMARLHADSVIRQSYVREVVRLVKSSNINIVKSDVEFEENQEDINKDIAEAKENANQQSNSNDLFTMEAEQRNQQNAQAPAASEKKTKLTYEEYTRISMIIIKIVQEFEREGQEPVQQSEILNKVMQKIVVDENAGTSISKSADTVKKIGNCINHLITKESVLMVTQDSKVKNERLLCLNINVDASTLNLGSAV